MYCLGVEIIFRTVNLNILLSSRLQVARFARKEGRGKKLEKNEIIYIYIYI
jgi:hypothetical protein